MYHGRSRYKFINLFKIAIRFLSDIAIYRYIQGSSSRGNQEFRTDKKCISRGIILVSIRDSVLMTDKQQLVNGLMLVTQLSSPFESRNRIFNSHVTSQHSSSKGKNFSFRFHAYLNFVRQTGNFCQQHPEELCAKMMTISRIMSTVLII